MTGGSQGSTPALTGVPSIGAIVNCTSGTFPCPAGGGSSPYGWGAGTSLGETVLAAGYHPPPGSIAFHDYAIINDSYTASSLGSGGLGNNGHNPLLIGPVTFAFSGAFTGVTDVSFLWGTDGAPTNGICLTCSTDTHDGDDPPVPEPASMLLFGTGLLESAQRRGAVSSASSKGDRLFRSRTPDGAIQLARPGLFVPLYSPFCVPTTALRRPLDSPQNHTG